MAKDNNNSIEDNDDNDFFNLQSLQFKIIHRHFPCNYRLHLWNIVEDSKCTYCNVVDTLSHYFAECQVVKGTCKMISKQIQNDIQAAGLHSAF